MTDRLQGFAVIFETPMREDDAEPILNAVRLLKYVKIVTPIVVVGSDTLAAMRAKQEAVDAIVDVCQDIMTGKVKAREKPHAD